MLIGCIYVDLQLLFPANINNVRWVAIEVDLAKRVINIYDSKPNVIVVDHLVTWGTCLRKMLPSLLVRTLPNAYSDTTPFQMQRLEGNVPEQDGLYK